MSLKARIPHLLAIERPHDRHNGKAVQQNLGDYDRTGEDPRMKRYQFRKADVVLARDFSIGPAAHVRTKRPDKYRHPSACQRLQTSSCIIRHV